MITTPQGAYGLSLPDLRAAHRLIAPPATWTEWSHRVVLQQHPQQATQVWTTTEAVFHLGAGGTAYVDRATATTTLALTAEPTDEAMIHPHLGVTAAVVSNWTGGTSFHGGGLLSAQGAWGVLGEREDGKSSALGWCAINKVPVLTDDLLVVHGTTAMAGPRCIDLRESAADHFQAGEDLGVVGTRRRWRVPLPLVDAEVPLAGWLVLQWGDAISTRQLSPPERFARLVGNRGFRLEEAAPEQWTRLLALPMVELVRPRDWSLIDEAMATLMETLSA